MKHYSEVITIEADKRFGKPCIRGTRISVYDVLGWLASGMSALEITEDYPELTDEDIRAASRMQRIENTKGRFMIRI